MNLSSKNDYIKVLLKLYVPLSKFYNKTNTQIIFGNKKTVYSNRIKGIEGFSRILWGLGPLLSCENLENSSYLKNIFEQIINGLIIATKTGSKNAWEIPKDQSQIFVEMTPIAVFFLLNKEKITKFLNKKEINQIFKYLNYINLRLINLNNWQFFRVIVNTMFYEYQSKYYNETLLKQALLVIETKYIGSGWYVDGRINQKDYYIAFGYHFYGLLFNKFMSNKKYDNFKKSFIKRAKKFYFDFIHYFNKDGHSIPFGRSLIYRFASSCFFSALALNNIYPSSVSDLKWYIENNLKFWLSNKSIFNKSGLLNLGYAYENIEMTEEYNSDTSPYWALKVFLILNLDENDVLFKTKSKRKSLRAKVHHLKKLTSIIVEDKNEEKYLINGGQFPHFNPNHSIEKYLKYIYSTKHSFCISKYYKKSDLISIDNFPIIISKKKILHRQVDFSKTENNIGFDSIIYRNQLFSKFGNKDYNVIVNLKFSNKKQLFIYKITIIKYGNSFGIFMFKGFAQKLSKENYKNFSKLKFSKNIYVESNAEFEIVNELNAINSNLLFKYSYGSKLEIKLKKEKTVIIKIYVNI